MNSEKFGKFLADLRIERKLTQEKVAEMLNIDKRKISRWETGNATPELEFLIKLSKIYKVTIYELSIGQRLPYESLIDKANKKFKTITDLTKWKIKRVIAIILAIIIGFLFGLAVIFTIDNYNTVKIYTLQSLDKTFDLKGNYIKAKDYVLFNIVSLKYTTPENNNELNINVKEITFEILNGKHKVLYQSITNHNTLPKETYNLLTLINNSSFTKEFLEYHIDENDELIFRIKYIIDENNTKFIDFNFKLIKKFQNTL